jgi:hypothetical protein
MVATVGIVFVRHEGEIRSIETGHPLRHPAQPCNTLPRMSGLRPRRMINSRVGGSLASSSSMQHANMGRDIPRCAGATIGALTGFAGRVLPAKSSITAPVSSLAHLLERVLRRT